MGSIAWVPTDLGEALHSRVHVEGRWAWSPGRTAWSTMYDDKVNKVVYLFPFEHMSTGFSVLREQPEVHHHFP